MTGRSCCEIDRPAGLKPIIIRSVENICSKEIEDLLCEAPGIHPKAVAKNKYVLKPRSAVIGQRDGPAQLALAA